MMTTSRRALRIAGRAARRSVPAIVAVFLLAGLLGTTLAGALTF